MRAHHVNAIMGRLLVLPTNVLQQSAPIQKLLKENAVLNVPKSKDVMNRFRKKLTGTVRGLPQSKRNVILITFRMS